MFNKKKADRSTVRRRSLWAIDESLLNADSAEGPIGEAEQAEARKPVSALADSTLVGSRVLHNGIREMHMPVIDIDFEVELVPSRTPSHYHLYLQKEITWERYVVLLQALAFAGVIEQGYLNTSIIRGQTFVRTAPLKNRSDS